jgi:hypothetical protein
MNFPYNIHSVAQIHPAPNNPNITDASLEFGLIQQQITKFQQELDHRLARMEATIANTRILSRNQRYIVSLRPLQKYVSFSSCYAVHLWNSSLIPLD